MNNVNYNELIEDNKIEHMLKDISYGMEILGDEIGKIEERLGI